MAIHNFIPIIKSFISGITAHRNKVAYRVGRTRRDELVAL